MLFIVDELLGFKRIPNHYAHYEVKPVKIKSKYSSLQEFFKELKPVWRSRKLPLLPYQRSDELEYFSNVSTDEQTIVYFYDPRYTSVETLSRLRSWLMPEKLLYPIPVYGNIAETLWLIETAHHWLKLRQSSTTTYPELLQYVEELQSRVSRWVLSPLPMNVIRWNKRNTLYKPLTKKSFSLIEILPNQKLEIVGSGELTDLWGKLTEQTQEKQRIWAVRKGVSKELQGAHHQIVLEEPVLPVNIPFVQVAVVPAF